MLTVQKHTSPIVTYDPSTRARDQRIKPPIMRKYVFDLCGSCTGQTGGSRVQNNCVALRDILDQCIAK